MMIWAQHQQPGARRGLGVVGVSGSSAKTTKLHASNSTSFFLNVDFADIGYLAFMECFMIRQHPVARNC